MVETIFVEHGFSEDTGKGIEIHKRKVELLNELAEELKEDDNGTVGHRMGEIIESIADADQPDLILSEAHNRVKRTLESAEIPTKAT